MTNKNLQQKNSKKETHSGKSSKKLPKVTHDLIKENVGKSLLAFEVEIKEMFNKWLSTLSEEEYRAHFDWILSPAGESFLNNQWHLVSRDVFRFFEFTKDSYEEDGVNDPGSEVYQFMQQVVDSESYLKDDGGLPIMKTK